MQPISQLMPSVRRFPAISGSSIKHKKRQSPQKTHFLIIFLWAGPTICRAISKGLAVSLMRPSGGGSVGEWLGSDRASPTLFASALYKVKEKKVTSQEDRCQFASALGRYLPQHPLCSYPYNSSRTYLHLQIC